ncbi:MAG: hypothetical protein QXG38_04000 [Candidatus Hadarchaeales archaeon]
MLEYELNAVVEKQEKWKDRILDALSGVGWLKIDSKPPFIHFEWTRPLRDFDVLDIVFSFQRLARKQNKISARPR